MSFPEEGLVGYRGVWGGTLLVMLQSCPKSCETQGNTLKSCKNRETPYKCVNPRETPQNRVEVRKTP